TFSGNSLPGRTKICTCRFHGSDARFLKSWKLPMKRIENQNGRGLLAVGLYHGSFCLAVTAAAKCCAMEATMPLDAPLTIATWPDSLLRSEEHTSELQSRVDLV